MKSRQPAPGRVALLTLLIVAPCLGIEALTRVGDARTNSLIEPSPEARTAKGVSRPRAAIADDPTIYLDQGWNEADRSRFYYTSQGSRMVPYRWLAALEQPESDQLVLAPENMDRLRFVTEPERDETRNPDGLPIGFVKDVGVASPPPDPALVRALIDKDYDPDNYPKTAEWVGFTCAACHTGRIDCGNKVLRIDGGPAMADMQTFLAELNRSLGKTLDDDAKKARFVRRVLGEMAGPEATATLLKELATYAKLFDYEIKSNAVPEVHQYGFGRLDAFGAIFNRVSSYGLGIAKNQHRSDAPVSYPPLWDTPFFDWVQSNGSSSSPIGRNMGEVLGVFADFRLTAPDPQRFQSSGKVRDFALLEDWVKTLKSPKWPDDLGAGFELDPDKVAKGGVLFSANCGSCHSLRDKDGQFPQNPEMATRPGASIIRTQMVALKDIGTDSKFVENFDIQVDPGIFAAQPGIDGKPRVIRALLLFAATRNIIVRQMIEAGFKPGTPEFDARFAELNSFHKVGAPAPLGGQGYKARPLNGVWATAPYLHNGSVPNLDQLLRPAAARAKSFYVGSRKFDPRLVGFVSSPSAGAFKFRTTDDSGLAIPGNSNAGHSGPSYTQTKGENGEFRDFNDAERAQLIEFIKTLR